MPLALTEEQQLLKQTALDFFKEKAPIKALRKLRDTKDAAGFSRELWQEMAELGWAGIIFPEEYGGSDFGYFGLGLVLEAAGHTLAATPLFSTVLLCGSAVLLAGNEAQRRSVLPEIAVGKRLLALAVDEGPRHQPLQIALKATKAGGGYKLEGEKVFVLDGHVADQLVVAARTSGKPGDAQGITLFLVDAKAAGITRTRSFMVDSRNAARIRFHDVAVGADAVLGEVDQGAGVLEQVLDRGRIGLAAEMLGSAAEAFDRTLNYLKTRKQFGVPIGSFQALKHRAAEMFCEIELAKSVVLDSLSGLDERRNDVAQLASLAKARLSDTLFLVSNEGVQMHGGIGMTDEEEIGFFMKRARVAQATFGDAAFHRDRYATLEGF